MANRNMLLVEGRDDEHVFYSLLKYYKVPQAFKIKNKGGINRLLKTLDVELLAIGLEKLAVVIDANSGYQLKAGQEENRLTVPP